MPANNVVIPGWCEVAPVLGPHYQLNNLSHLAGLVVLGHHHERRLHTITPMPVLGVQRNDRLARHLESAVDGAASAVVAAGVPVLVALAIGAANNTVILKLVI